MMTNETESSARTGAIVAFEPQPPLSVEQILQHSALIKEVQNRVMIEGQHYGIIPGTPKPTLYQPGAQILAVVFKLAAEFDYDVIPLPNGHREVIVKTTIKTQGGMFLGHGLGSCSTMESKYRYHNDTASFEGTPHIVPKSYWQLKEAKDKNRMLASITDDQIGSYGVKKLDHEGKPVPKGAPGGDWYIVRYSEERAKIENPNIADCYNTVFKIAAKRSFVYGILNTTAASDVYHQDLEDLQDNLRAVREEHGNGGAFDGMPTSDVDDPHRVSYKQAAKEPTKSPRASLAQETTRERMGYPADDPANNPEWEADEIPGLTMWRDVVVHVKSTLQNRKLGDLQLSQLKVIRDWLDRQDWTQPHSKADHKLKAAVLMGIAELEAPEVQKAVGVKEPEIDDRTNLKLPDERKNLLAKVRELMQNAILVEEDFMTHAHKRKQCPDEAQKLDDIPNDWLTQYIEQWPKLMEAWGQKLPDPKEKKKGAKK